MEEKKLEKRMYFLTMYNISPIQQAIQCGHAQMEYALMHWNDEDFQDWAKNWKTWVILNGGTSNDGTQTHYGQEKMLGSMEDHLVTLVQNNIKVAYFKEPDLNYSLSAIALIVDERVFNREDYPDFPEFLAKKGGEFSYTFNMELETQYAKEYAEWVEFVGGEKNVFLKTFLKNFRLA
jgi:hypothetical protein